MKLTFEQFRSFIDMVNMGMTEEWESATDMMNWISDYIGHDAELLLSANAESTRYIEDGEGNFVSWIQEYGKDFLIDIRKTADTTGSEEQYTADIEVQVPPNTIWETWLKNAMADTNDPMVLRRYITMFKCFLLDDFVRATGIPLILEFEFFGIPVKTQTVMMDYETLARFQDFVKSNHIAGKTNV